MSTELLTRAHVRSTLGAARDTLSRRATRGESGGLWGPGALGQTALADTEALIRTVDGARDDAVLPDLVPESRLFALHSALYATALAAGEAPDDSARRDVGALFEALGDRRIARSRALRTGRTAGV